MTQMISELLPHNDYIRAMAEGGILGLVAFLSLFTVLLFRLLQQYQTASSHQARHLCLILLALTIATLIGMVTENIWSHTVFFYYLSALLPIAEWEWPENETSSRSYNFSKKATDF